MRPYTLNQISSTFGAVILGCDLSVIGEEAARALAEDLLIHRVLVVPGQHLTHDDHIRVGRSFGRLATNAHPEYTVPGYPEILVISNIFKDGAPIGLYDGDDEEEWHTDHSWKKEMSSASLLYSVIAPAEGGETRFSDTTTAYDELPAGIRERIGQLSAVHSMAHLTRRQNEANHGVSSLGYAQVAHIPDVTHPLVRLHPVTGRRSLLLGSMIIRSIDGLSDSGSAELLEALLRHATDDRYVYRHKWSPGDLVIWDNRATMHTASPCDSRRHHRLLYRATAHD